MTAAITAMITAVVGVLGTLFAPILAQRLTARQRGEEAELADARRKFEERRAQYTAMNRASRQFHTLLKDALHRIRDRVYTEQERAQLEEARLDHRDRYAEAQMYSPSASCRRPATSTGSSRTVTRPSNAWTAAYPATARASRGPWRSSRRRTRTSTPCGS